MKRRWLGAVSLLAAFSLVMAACGDDDATTTTTGAPTGDTTATTAAPATTVAAPATTAAPDDGGVAFDTGVTPAPCPDAVNEGNGCIYLGILSDLTDGPFFRLAIPLTEAQEDFWNGVNADGGLDGFDVIISAENTFDHHYDPALTVEGYAGMRDRVLMLAQLLGTPQTQAVLPDLVADNTPAAPATWWSGIAFSDPPPNGDGGLILESGAPYCIEAMNSMFFATDQMGTDVSWALVTFPGDYGGDYSAGVKIAAAQLGMSEPVAEVLQIPFSVGGTADEAVAALVAAAPNLIVVVTGPLEMAAIVGGTFGAGHQAFKVMGAAPTWNVGFLANPDLVGLLQAVYWVSAPWGGWSTDTAGHAAMRAAAEANGRDPNPAYGFGWIWQYPVKALLEQAIESGDLTRGNLASLARSLSGVDYQGVLPTRSYVGAANDHIERSSLINTVDPEEPDGLTPLTDAFVSQIAADFNLAAPCFVG